MHFYVIPDTWVAECMHFYVIPATWVAQCMHFYIIPATGLQNVCIFIGKMHRNQFNQPVLWLEYVGIGIVARVCWYRYSPCRCTQAAAKQDLRKAQAADNHKQYADVLKQLRKAAKSAASEAPTGVTQPAASASQQQASATTFEKQCQQILDYRRAHGGRAPCQSKSDPNEHQLGQMKSKLKRRCQKAVGVKPSQIKLTPEQSSHLDWCLSDEALHAADCRAPSDHSEPATHVNNDENPSSPNKRLRTRAAKKKAEIQQRNIGSGSTTTVNQ